MKLVIELTENQLDWLDRALVNTKVKYLCRMTHALVSKDKSSNTLAGAGGAKHNEQVAEIFEEIMQALQKAYENC